MGGEKANEIFVDGGIWQITYMVFVWNDCIVSERDVTSAPTSWEMSLYALIMLFTFGWIVDKGDVAYMTLDCDLGVRPPFIMIFPP